MLSSFGGFCVSGFGVSGFGVWGFTGLGSWALTYWGKKFSPIGRGKIFCPQYVGVYGFWVLGLSLQALE